MDSLSFWVPGVPLAKPAWNRSTSSRLARQRAAPWFKSVRRMAEHAVRSVPMATWPLFPPEQPLVLEVTYYMPRPKSHFRTGRRAGELKPTAFPWPVTKPDLTNLTKGLEDVLADWPRGQPALVYAGDQQIVDHVIRKRWANSDPGAEVRVMRVFEDPS